jgi:hypothetical protein
MFDWVYVQGALATLVFLSFYQSHQIGKDFNRLIREHDTIFNDLERIEKKIDYIEESLTELRNR